MSTMPKDPFALKPGCSVEPGTDKNHPAVKVHRDYQPPDSHPYYVTDEDNWLSLVGDNLDAAKKLIRFNFNTNHPPYINWYLRHYIGCTRRTLDHKNYRFSSNDRYTNVSQRAGIVYFPNDPVILDGDTVKAGNRFFDLRFKANFFADSLLADEIDAIMAIAETAIAGGVGYQMKKKLAKWIRSAGKIGGSIGSKILGAIGAIYKCQGTLACEVVDVPGSTFCWRFMGYLVGKDIPFSGDGPDYNTSFSRPVRYNLGVLDPRRDWLNKQISFTLSRNSAAIRVHRALRQRISDSYRPFTTYETTNTDLNISMPLVGVGPIGLATTPPGLWMDLKPFGLIADMSALEMLSKIFARDFD